MGRVLVPRWFAGEPVAVVVDRFAIVSAAGPVVIATSTDQFFSSDSVAVRATMRVGSTAVRPERIGKFTIVGAPVAKPGDRPPGYPDLAPQGTGGQKRASEKIRTERYARVGPEMRAARLWASATEPQRVTIVPR